MRATTVLLGIVVLFVLLLAVSFASSSGAKATTNAVAPQQAATAQGLAPRGTVLGKGSQQIGDLTVWLSAPARPPVRGQNEIEALVLTSGGQPVTNAKVYFDLDMTNMSHGKNVVAAPHAGEGRYAGSVFFMMPGPWRVIVTIERGGKSVGTARFDFNVNLR